MPAIARALDPSLFPRDTRAARRADAPVARRRSARRRRRARPGVDLPPLFLGVYLLTLVVLVRRGCRASRARSAPRGWPSAAFLAAAHAAPSHREDRRELARRLHPPADARVRARPAGARLRACADAPVCRRVSWRSSRPCHAPTTALWFARRAGSRRWSRPPGVAIVALLAASARRSLGAAGRRRAARAAVSSLMDAEWLSVLADKDYLFSAEWPLYAWADQPRLSGRHRGRSTGAASRRGSTAPGEAALVAALLALVARVSGLRAALDWRAVALAVQLQITRVFWLLDFVTAAYLAWWLTRTWRAAAIRAPTWPSSLASRSLAVGRGVLRRSRRGGSPARRSVSCRPTWTDAMAGSRRSRRRLARAGRSRPRLEVRRRASASRRPRHGARTGQGHGAGDVRSRRGDARRPNARPRSATSTRLRPTMSAALAARYGLDVFVDRANRTLALPVLYRERRLRGVRPPMTLTDASRGARRRFAPRRWLGNGHAMTVYAWARGATVSGAARARSPAVSCRRRHAGARALLLAAGSSRAADARRAARPRGIERGALHARAGRQGLARAAGTRCCSTSATAAAPST